MDILLDPETHDVVYDNSQVTVTPEKGYSVAQRLKIKLMTFQGEWFLDTLDGIPYYQQIFGKGRTKTVIDSIFREAILSEPGVVEITEFESVTGDDRSYTLTFRVRTTLDQITDNISIVVGA